jgi:UDP-glucose 4-epimerase
MKILVTGGAGFLGSHVADALTEAGHEVTIFDIRKSPYLSDNQKMVIGDILDSETVTRAIDGNQVVYHFAGIADIDECTEKPVETAHYNIIGTIKLLEGCRDVGVQRFIFASSAYVYSNSGYFYRSSKQACESYIENYNELYGLPYTCLRYGSLYGDRSDDRNSIYKMIKQAFTDGKITYCGNGDEIREFIHVKDAAQSSVEVLKDEYENQHIILTGYERFTYKQLVEMIVEIIGNNISVEFKPSTRAAHYKITPYNFSPKLGKKLVNNPHIDMGQGMLQCMAEIYEKCYSNKHTEMGLIINDQ